MLDKNFFIELITKTLTNIKKSIFKVEITNPQQPIKEVKVSNQVEIPAEIAVSNLKEVQEVKGEIDVNQIDKIINSLKEIADKEMPEQKEQLKEIQVKDFDKLLNKKTFPASIKIENLQGIIGLLEKIKNKSDVIQFPNTFKISNLGEIPQAEAVREVAIKEFNALLDALKNVSLLNNNPRKPVAVRLSDGERFYNSIANAVISSSGGKATEKKQDEIIAQGKYNLSDLDKDSDTKYFGFVDKDGKYYIMRLTATTARYCKGDSGYTTAWTARNSQTYLHYYEIF